MGLVAGSRCIRSHGYKYSGNHFTSKERNWLGKIHGCFMLATYIDLEASILENFIRKDPSEGSHLRKMSIELLSYSCSAIPAQTPRFRSKIHNTVFYTMLPQRQCVHRSLCCNFGPQRLHYAFSLNANDDYYKVGKYIRFSMRGEKMAVVSFSI